MIIIDTITSDEPLPKVYLYLRSPLVLNVHIRPSWSSIHLSTGPACSRIHLGRNLIFDEFTSSCNLELEDTLVLHRQSKLRPIPIREWLTLR
jgi:hypothetical protein